LSETPRFIWGLSKRSMKRTPEEFPNDIKNPYNQWETPLKFSYYKLLHPPNKFEGSDKSECSICTGNSSGVIQQTLITR
jgi:hypothetical protein